MKSRKRIGRRRALLKKKRRRKKDLKDGGHRIITDPSGGWRPNREGVIY